MHRDELIKYLGILGEALKEIDRQGEIILTGGAVMCLVHSARDMTKDIDALYEPKSEINRLAAKIARQYDLPQGWLNDSVKGFVSHSVETEDFLQLGNLKVSTVTPDYPKDGSWTHSPVLRSACQARREDAVGSCLQGRATQHGAPSAVLAGA